MNVDEAESNETRRTIRDGGTIRPGRGSQPGMSSTSGLDRHSFMMHDGTKTSSPRNSSSEPDPGLTLTKNLLLLIIVGAFLPGCSPRKSIHPALDGRFQPPTVSETHKSKSVAITMHVSTYLLFDGNCRAAMAFYHSVFGGELAMTTVGDSPMKTVFPSSLHARIVYARLKAALIDLSASDWLQPGERPVKGNMTSLYVSGGSPDATATLFRQLADGAEVTDPLRDHPFGLYGALNDRFGVRWRFHAEKP